MPVTRKVLIRVIGAPLLLAALGAILFLDYRNQSSIGLRWLLAAVAALSAIEFYGLCRAKGIETAHVVATICLVGWVGPWTWLAKLVGLRGLLAYMQVVHWHLPILLALYALLKLVFRYERFTVEGAALTLLGYGYVSLLGFLMVLPVDPRVGTWYLLFLVAANKGSDMAAYGVGKSIGRHKMTPVLSPNKTWEGCMGGAIGGTGAALAVLLATPLREAYAGVPVAALLFFALLVTMAAQVGDLVESAFKRWAGVKDSGRLLPEFGGMLDMVDSFLISIPVAHFAGDLVLGTYRGT